MTTVLLVRVSSLGDVVQTFPAVTDMQRHVPDLQLDWVVEEAYVPLVRMHPAVARALSYPLRRWRKSWYRGATWRELGALRRTLREHRYDAIIEAQGLFKSAVAAKWARGPVHGFGPDTVREPFVARFYDHRHEFAADVHRVWHYRGLAARAFGYMFDEAIDYGLRHPAQPVWLDAPRYVVLLHSTARSEKLWPERDWIALGRHLSGRGVISVLPWGDERERARAMRLAGAISGAQIAPPLRVDEAGALLAHARAVVGVDTGLMHLAVALETPVVGIYRATRPVHHGPLGRGPTAFCGGLDRTPAVDDVLDGLRTVAPDLA